MKDIKPAQNQQFSEILGQIQSAKQQAYSQVNKTLVELYWNIGKYVSTQVAQAQWGKNTVEQLAEYIQQNEPSISGFTASNIWLKNKAEERGFNQWFYCQQHLADETVL